MLKAIVNSAKKAWRGEEKLWRVFWLWGAMLYVLENLLIIAVVNLGMINFVKENLIVYLIFSILKKISGIIGILLIFLHPIFLLKALWSCRNQTAFNILWYVYILFFLLFLWFHILWGFVLLLTNISFIFNN